MLHQLTGCAMVAMLGAQFWHQCLPHASRDIRSWPWCPWLYPM